MTATASRLTAFPAWDSQRITRRAHRSEKRIFRKLSYPDGEARSGGNPGREFGRASERAELPGLDSNQQPSG